MLDVSQIKSMKTLHVITAATLMLSSNLLAESGLPYEAKDLIGKRDAALIRMNIELKRQLEQMKNKYTKRGDLDSANKIDAYIKSIQVSNPRWDTLDLIRGRSFTWRKADYVFSKEFVLDKSGEIKKYDHDNEDTWRVDDSGALLIYNADGKLQWTFKKVELRSGKVYMETVGGHCLIEN